MRTGRLALSMLILAILLVPNLVHGQPRPISGMAFEAAPLSSESGGYLFEDIQVANQPDPLTGAPLPGHARVTYRASWSNGEFPGEHTCTWQVLDDSETVIGENIGSFTSLEEVSSDFVHVDVNVEGVPASARISCEEERLDSAGGRFAISDVRVKNPETPRLAWQVLFTYAWRGGGNPAAQSCNIRVYDSTGSFLFEQVTNFVTGSRGPRGGRFMLQPPDDVKADPGSVEVACRPF